MVAVSSVVVKSLSIVIVNWNTADMTCACIASIFSVKAELDCEIIVVDNASSDESVARIKSTFPDIILIENASNLGFGAANNLGFAKATGDYVLALNSDTLVIGNVLQNSIAYLDRHPEVGAMGCRVLNPDRTIQFTCSGYPSILNLLLQVTGLSKLPWPLFLDRYRMHRWNRTDEREVEVISGCYLMVPKSIISEVGGFDEDFFFFGEETDWCRRIGKTGKKLMFAPVGEIIHYGGGSVKRLDFRRDLMLSSAIVKLHQKNGGLISAIVTMGIVCGFNFSRALYYSILSLVSKQSSTLERRRHFIDLTVNSLKIWPRGRTYNFE